MMSLKIVIFHFQNKRFPHCNYNNMQNLFFLVGKVQSISWQTTLALGIYRLPESQNNRAAKEKRNLHFQLCWEKEMMIKDLTQKMAEGRRKEIREDVWGTTYDMADA